MSYEDNEVVDAGPGLTDEVEAEIGQSLPQALREHYAEYNGGQLENAAFRAPDGQAFELHEFLAMRPGAGEFEETFKQARVDLGFLPDTLVPFAIDPGGALFCISDAPDTAGHVFLFNTEGSDEPDEATTVNRHRKLTTCRPAKLTPLLCGDLSVAAEPTWWFDGLKFAEVEVTDALQRLGRGAVPQVVRLSHVAYWACRSAS